MNDVAKPASACTWVYIVTLGTTLSPCKVGITGNLVSRLRGYQTADADRSYRFHAGVLLESREQALALEAAVLAAGYEAGWPRQNEWLHMAASIVETLLRDELEATK